MTGTETPLGGGNMSSGVVRSGDTVRRPAGPWTSAVHALLAHLHDAGKIRVVALDKTGTLTAGVMTVSAALAAPGTDEKEALLLAEGELPQNCDSPALPFPL
jgi:hypothetical protein